MKEYRFSQLQYTPTDFAAYQAEVDRLIAQVRGAASLQDVLDAIRRMDALGDAAALNLYLPYIRSDLDCRDEAAAQALQHEGAGNAMTDDAPFYQALLESPFLPQLEARFGSEFRPRLEKQFRLNAAGLELIAREAELTAEYQRAKTMLRGMFQGQELSLGEIAAYFTHPERQMRFEARKVYWETLLAQREHFAALLMELLSVRRGIAEANGFANYLDYQNTCYDRRGYGEEELAAFCAQVKEHLVPLLRELQEKLREELGVDKLMVWDALMYSSEGSASLTGTGDAFLTETTQAMFDALSPEMGSFLRHMTATESVNAASSPDKISGMAYCAFINHDLAPFVLVNPSGVEGDAATLVHELGHAWSYWLISRARPLRLLTELPHDMSELPSRAMEFFLYDHAEEFFGGEAELFRRNHFCSALRNIAAFCSSHEFETWAYTHPEASFEELAAQQYSIDVRYGLGLDAGELNELRLQGADLIQDVGFYTLPRYVIGYSLSYMGALDLFRRYAEDPAGTLAAYNAVCASGGVRSYPETLALAGLDMPFVPGAVEQLVAFARSYLHMA